jgi:hypothetical protein
MKYADKYGMTLCKCGMSVINNKAFIDLHLTDPRHQRYIEDKEKQEHEKKQEKFKKIWSKQQTHPANKYKLEIFSRKNRFINTFITPWFNNCGAYKDRKNDEYIRNSDEFLSQDTYYVFSDHIQKYGHVHVFGEILWNVFDKNKIDKILSNLIGEAAFRIDYVPFGTISGLFQLELTEDMCMVAFPTHITENLDCIIMTSTRDENFKDSQEQIEIKLLCSMGIWGVYRGIYYIKPENRIVRLDFDLDRFEKYTEQVKKWAIKQ